MGNISSLLGPQGQKYRTGETNLQEELGHPVDTNGCTILLCTAGRAIVTTNFTTQVLKQGDAAILFSDIFFIPLQTSRTFSAIYVLLDEEVVEEAFYKMTSMSFWDFIHDNPICRLNEQQYRLMHGWCQHIKWTINECVPEYRLPILSSSIQHLLMGIDSEARQSVIASTNRSKKNSAWTLLGKFATLLSKHCRETREVKFYAEQMCITTDYLYKISNKTLQMTPKEVIDQQVITEIKTYLISTALSVKDIAVKLNFEDPSYMCRFFRKKTGFSPIDYRNKSPE